MKHFLSILLAISLAVSLVSCSSTRKVASEQTQQSITSTVTTDINTQSNTSEAIEQRKTETDLSNVVIDFTKIEYADGTQTITTNTEAQCDTVKQRDSEATEPPNVAQNIKTVTSGRVTINNDKTTQTETTASSNNATQTETNSDLTEETTLQNKTEEKEKHGFFYYFGIIACILFASFFVYRVYRFSRRNKIL